MAYFQETMFTGTMGGQQQLPLSYWVNMLHVKH